MMEEDNTSKKRSHQSISTTSQSPENVDIPGEVESGDDDVKREDASNGADNEDDASNNGTKDGPDDNGSDSDINSRSKREERRLEMNRQRAKDIRRRKKKMMEEMQKQIVFLTMENNKLRTQNQMQQAEIHLLRNSQQDQVSFQNQR